MWRGRIDMAWGGIAGLALAITITGVAAARAPSEVERRYTKAYDSCLSHGDAAQGVTPAMRDCNFAEMERQNAALNAAWPVAMARRTPAQQADLRRLERLWIAHRDKVCAPEPNGGTDALLFADACEIDETIRRTIWLEHLR